MSVENTKIIDFISEEGDNVILTISDHYNGMKKMSIFFCCRKKLTLI